MESTSEAGWQRGEEELPAFGNASLVEPCVGRGAHSLGPTTNRAPARAAARPRERWQLCQGLLRGHASRT